MIDMMECTDIIKVLYICVSGNGGSNQALLSTLGELRLKGIHPLIVVPDVNTAKFYNLHKYETQVVYMRQEIMPSYNSIKKFLLFLPLYLFNYFINLIAYMRLKIICKSFAPDIIHSNITVTSLGYKLSRRFNIPHIWHIREYVQKPIFGSKKLTMLLNKENTILITKGLQTFYHIENSKTHIIYDGVNYEAKQVGSTDIFPRKYFVCVGRITRAKGIDLLVDSFIPFAKKCSDIDLLLIGEGKPEYINSIKETVERNNIQNRIHFTGSKSHDETMAYMKNAEALIVPSLSEGFGLITAEAMFNKCLVVGNNNTGTKEQFDNGVEITGQEIGLRFNNSEELSDIMFNISSNGRNFYGHLIENAHRTVNQLYTVSNNGMAVYNYYKSIINKNI